MVQTDTPAPIDFQEMAAAQQDNVIKTSNSTLNLQQLSLPSTIISTT